MDLNESVLVIAVAIAFCGGVLVGHHLYEHFWGHNH